MIKKLSTKLICAVILALALVATLAVIVGATEPVAPKILSADDLEWVVPDEGLTKVYDGNTDYPGVATVRIKAGVVAEYDITVLGRMYFSSPDVGQGNYLIFECNFTRDYTLNYVIPAGIRLTHEASITPNEEGVIRNVGAFSAKVYDGLPISNPIVNASNGAQQDEIIFSWVDGNDEPVDAPILPGDYFLYITVPDNANGKGCENHYAGATWIATKDVSLGLPVDIGIDKAHFNIDDLRIALEKSFLRNISSKNTTLTVSLEKQSGCEYKIECRVMQGDTDVTAGYNFGLNDTYNIHVGTRWHGQFYCDTCFENVWDSGSVNGYLEVLNPIYQPEPFDENFPSNNYFSVQDPICFGKIDASRPDVVLQLLIGDKPMSLDELRQSDDWQTAWDEELYDIDKGLYNYVYMRWIALNGEEGEYQMVNMCFINDTEAPSVPASGKNVIYLGDTSATVTDNCGIVGIVLIIEQIDENGNRLPIQRKEIFRCKWDKAPTSFKVDIPYISGIWECACSIQVIDIKGNLSVYYVNMMSVSAMTKSVDALTVDNVRVSDMRSLKNLREQLSNAKGTISESVKAERDAAIANIDTLLAKIEDMDKAESALYADVDAAKGKLDTMSGDMDAVKGKLDTISSDADTIPSETETPKSQLPTVAIVAISVGVTLVLTFGILALIWFVMKKKEVKVK